MTTRAHVLSTIQKEANRRGVTWTLVREGGNHTIYALNGVIVPIARHNEFEARYTEMVYKECEPVFGKGWWR